MSKPQPKRYGMTRIELIAFRLTKRVLEIMEFCECANCSNQAICCHDCPDCEKKVRATIKRTLQRVAHV